MEVGNPIDGSADSVFRFHCRAAQLPASTIPAIDVPYFGRQVRMAGNRTFEPWTVTVLNDTDFSIRRAFERWMNILNKHEDNAGVINPGEYSILQGDTILDIIERAGGFSEDSFSEGAVYLREDVATQQKEGFLRTAEELENTMIDRVFFGILVYVPYFLSFKVYCKNIVHIKMRSKSFMSSH